VASVGREISVSAFITVIVFAGLLFSDIPAINEIAFYFIVVVLVDGFIYRLFLTPTMMSTLGEWNWWPIQLFSEILTPLLVEDNSGNDPTLRPTFNDREDYRRSVIRDRRSMMSPTTGERDASAAALMEQGTPVDDSSALVGTKEYVPYS